MSKKSALHVTGDDLPRELVDFCLKCKKSKCVGKCSEYAEAVRKYNEVHGKSTRARNMTGIRTGYEPKRYDVYGQMLSTREICEMYSISRNTIRRHMKEGKSMQEVVEQHVWSKKRAVKRRCTQDNG